MNEQDFLKWAKNKVDEFHEQIVEPNIKTAQDDLIIEEFLNKELLQFLDENRRESKVILNRDTLVEEPSNVDMRVFMSDDRIHEVSTNGFTYHESQSTEDKLVFVPKQRTT